MDNQTPNLIVGAPGAADVKEIVRYIARIITTALDVKPSDCLLKNYGTITLNALQQTLKLFPELSAEINALASKFTQIQEASRNSLG
ncbi:hypothetical protein [Vulcanisaeta sp. JCM 14467]|uniref:hypothetical protein n=1 Tax=Vulcanisaeta sp. JCM 14467 TaxID=1295370 RepID=UPI000A427762|nr:hypothetical protein [Vulcanisaeta sp. JCM 14467]